MNADTHVCFMALVVCQFSIFSVNADDAGMRRRVLILPLTNTTKNSAHDWLKTSLADNLKTEIIRTKRFDVLDEKAALKIYPTLKFENLSQNEAATVAKGLNCELVTQGRFTVVGQKFRLEMEATDATTGKFIAAEKADGRLDSTMFSTIDTVVEALAADLGRTAPPLLANDNHRSIEIEKKYSTPSQPKIGEAATVMDKPNPPTQLKPEVKQQPVSIKRQYSANAYLSFGVPLGQIADHLGANFGIRASLRRNFLFPWLNPILIADSFYATGKDISGMLFYYVGAGQSYPFKLPLKFSVAPFATVGFSGGNLYYQNGYDFFVPALDAGLIGEYRLTESWHLSASVSYRFLIDKYMPSSFVQFHFGAGYSF